MASHLGIDLEGYHVLAGIVILSADVVVSCGHVLAGIVILSAEVVVSCGFGLMFVLEV